eukprot:3839189-Amphidinium_carterae.1
MAHCFGERPKFWKKENGQLVEAIKEGWPRCIGLHFYLLIRCIRLSEEPLHASSAGTDALAESVVASLA